MISLYLFCLIPVGLWLFLWWRLKTIVWIESVISIASSFLLAGIVHWISFKSQTGDTEYWSGSIQQVRQFSSWLEYWEKDIYRTEYYTETETYTDSNGKIQTRIVTKGREVFSHWEPRTEWHSKYNKAYSNINTSYPIQDSTFDQWSKDFGGYSKVKGDRWTFKHNSRMISGDPYDYVAHNSTNYIIPITKEVSFTNRIKAKRSVWSFADVPKGLDLPDRPVNSDPWKSNRLIGTAKDYFSIEALDKINATLGLSKQIDLVIVGFDSDNIEMSHYLESKWIGGTKNQLVITFGTNWVRVFGWSKSDVCKLNIESLLTKKKNDAMLLEVEQEIKKNYERRDWSEFNILSIEPSGTAWFWFILLMLIINGALVYFLHVNEFREI